MCEWRPDFERLDQRMDGLEDRLDRVEASTQGGFNSVNANIETVSKQQTLFSQQLTNMDKRMIEEKQKWGDTLRGIVKWTVRALLVAVTYAVGINVTSKIIPSLFN